MFGARTASACERVLAVLGGVPITIAVVALKWLMVLGHDSVHPEPNDHLFVNVRALIRRDVEASSCTRELLKLLASSGSRRVRE